MNETQLFGNWTFPTAIRFGLGRIGELADACRGLGIERPLLVTDPGLAELDPVAQALEACHDEDLPCGVFSDVRPNPTYSLAEY